MKKKKVSLEILNSRELSQEQMKKTFGGIDMCTPDCGCGFGRDEAVPLSTVADIMRGNVIAIH